MVDEENKIVSFGFTEGVLDLDVDANKDGEKVLKLSLNVNEAVQEAISKGEKLEGVSIVDFEFEGSTLNLQIDSDMDGEPVLKIKIDLMEAFDEIKDSFI